MPLYEYQCDSCEHRFELIQKFSDPPPSTCPSCGGPVRKLPSSPAIQFKGAGWYITDYARKGQSDAGKASGSKETGSSETTKSDGGKSSDAGGTSKSETTPSSSASDSSKS